MSFEKEIKETINIDRMKDGLKKVDEAIENIGTIQKLWKWIKRLSKLVKR